MTHPLPQTVFTFMALTALLTHPAAAQAPITVTGTVTDRSGGVLAGATVVAAGGDRLVTTVSEADGRYRLDLPSEGRYRLTVPRAGFTARSEDIIAVAGLTRDIQLAIAPLNDAVVVTASRTPVRQAVTTDSLRVFTAQDIQRSGASSLADIVGQVPGVHVAATGREGALTSLFARGGESDYNHVLVDGVRVNGSGGPFDFSRIAAGEIDRVEVVRGAQSALYGSDAIGSVIQIFTKRSQSTDPMQLSGSFEGGSLGTRRGDAWLRGGAGQRVDYQLGSVSRSTAGAFLDERNEPDRFDATSLHGGLGVVLSPQATLRTGVRYGVARGRALGPIAYGPADRGTRQDTEDLSWHLRFDHTPSTAVHHAATVSYFQWDELSADEVTDPSYTVHAILVGQPEARFPDSPRLVRLLDDTILSGARGRPPISPGRALSGHHAVRGARLSGHVPISVSSASGPLPGRCHVARGSDLERGIRVRARVRSAAAFSRRRARVLRPAAIRPSRPLARDPRRAR